MPTNALRIQPKMANPFISLKNRVKQNLLAQPSKINSKIPKNNVSITPIKTGPKETGYWVVPDSNAPYVLKNME